MRFVAIEYKDGTNNTDVKGYLRIPDNMPPNWTNGYRKYLKDVKKVKDSIDIYPLNIHLNSDTMGKPPTGYVNLEDDFNLALRSTKYYPIVPYEATRRAWSMMDPMSPDFVPKER